MARGPRLVQGFPARRIVLLSGRVGSGKSTLRDGLTRQFAFRGLRTSELLRAQLGNAVDRRRLQQLGRDLDRITDGRWVVDAVARRLEAQPEVRDVVIDAVRIQGQVDALRAAFGRGVFHIHLQARVEDLEQRYADRRPTSPGELDSYAAVELDPTEAQVDTLARDADLVIDTSRYSPPDTIVRAAALLSLYAPLDRRSVDVLVGGQFGSEGKGNIAGYLSSEYDLLVRNGGPNAGHTVYGFQGRHVQHHLPSGSTTSSAALLLGPGSLLKVSSLMKEIADSSVEVGRLTIDPQAMIITDEDVKAEERLIADIGSTGQGVGGAMARRILERGRGVTLAGSVPELGPYIGDANAVLENAIATDQKILVEGTQGTGLSLYHGDYPYVTSRDTTAAAFLSEAGIAASHLRKVIVVFRTYPIRVESPAEGNSGTMERELQWQDIADRSGIPIDDLLSAEVTTTTGRRRRVSEFNWTQLRRSSTLNGATDIALTFVDYLTILNRAAHRFEQLAPETIAFIEDVEQVAGAPVTLISTRFHPRSIIDRRLWER